MLASILRILPPSRARCIGHCIGYLFGMIGLGILAARLWQCGHTNAWHDLYPVDCLATSPLIITVVVGEPSYPPFTVPLGPISYLSYLCSGYILDFNSRLISVFCAMAPQSSADGERADPRRFHQWPSSRYHFYPSCSLWFQA
jgi:hypothetical protein